MTDDTPAVPPASYPSVLVSYAEDWHPLVLDALYRMKNPSFWRDGSNDLDTDLEAIEELLDVFAAGDDLYEELDFANGQQGTTVNTGTFNATSGYFEGVGTGHVEIFWPVDEPILIHEVYLEGEIRWSGGGTQIQIRAFDEDVVLFANGNHTPGDFYYGSKGLNQLCSDHLQFFVFGNASQTGTVKIKRVGRRYSYP